MSEQKTVQVGPRKNLNIPTLRSIADSIEPAFPSAADILRGIANDMARAEAAS